MKKDIKPRGAACFLFSRVCLGMHSSRSHALRFARISQGMVIFLVPLGRLRKDTREILLPTSENYTSVWKKYRNSQEPVSESGDRPLRVIGYQTFCRLWKQMTPHIRFMSPKTDLCDRCEELKSGISHALSHHYPFSCQQRGGKFFKTARKCQIGEFYL